MLSDLIGFKFTFWISEVKGSYLFKISHLEYYAAKLSCQNMWNNYVAIWNT